MIYTHPLNSLKINIPRARNTHLIPEARLRSKKILESIALEEVNSFDYYPQSVEFWRRLKSGRQCTCSSESINREIEKKESDNLSLSDFLLLFKSDLGSTQDFCPICFNTGFVGGYHKIGTYSIILDSTGSQINNINIEQSRPYVFRPTNILGIIQWEITIPKFFSKVSAYIR